MHCGLFTEWSCLATWGSGEEQMSLLSQTNSSTSSSTSLPSALTTSKDSAISSSSVFSCLALKEIDQELWISIGDCDDDESKVEQKGEEVDWRNLRRALVKAGDCAPQALATANSAPATFSLSLFLLISPLILIWARLREGKWGQSGQIAFDMIICSANISWVYLCSLIQIRGCIFMNSYQNQKSLILFVDAPWLWSCD